MERNLFDEYIVEADSDWNVDYMINEINANDITEQILYEAKTEEEKPKKEVKKAEKKESNKVSLKEIDDRLMTIDDFLGDF